LSVAAGLGVLSALVCRAQQRAAPAVNTGQNVAGWHDTVKARLEALALLQTLNADLLSHDSATLTLDRWCSAHRMASPPQVVADQLPQIQKPPTARQRQELQVTAGEPVRYRRVRLRCGNHVLSVADNWYVPDRLTPHMNHLLQTTDISFGRVVQPLHFSRHRLGAALLWNARSPWPKAAAEVLRHRALLVLPDGRPISEVIESYTAEVLSFPQPQSR
jgi:chorismate-pyruvate lyase